MATTRLGLPILLLIGGLGFPSLYVSTESCGCSSTDIDADGYCDVEDCAPEDPQSFPSADEVCDGVDNNCDGGIDENTGTLWYQDADGDGAGDSTHSVLACDAPAGYVGNADDCADGDASVHPGAVETCDQVDQDCDGEVDDRAGWSWYYDQDGDSFGNPFREQIICIDPASISGYTIVIDGLRFAKINERHKPDCFDAPREEYGDGQDYHPDYYPGDPEYPQGNVAENPGMEQDKNCDGRVQVLFDANKGYGPDKKIDIPWLGGAFEVRIDPILTWSDSGPHQLSLTLSTVDELSDPDVRRELYLNGTGENSVTRVGPQIKYELALNGVPVDESFYQQHYDFHALIRYPLQEDTIKGYGLSSEYITGVQVDFIDGVPYFVQSELFSYPGNFESGEYWTYLEHWHFSIYVVNYDEDLLIFRPKYAVEDYGDSESQSTTTPEPVVLFHEEEGNKQKISLARDWELSLLEITPTPEPTPEPCTGRFCKPTPTPAPEPEPTPVALAYYDPNDFIYAFYVAQFNDRTLSSEQLKYATSAWNADASLSHPLPGDTNRNYQTNISLENNTGHDLDLELIIAFNLNAVQVNALDALDSCSPMAKEWAVGSKPFENVARKVICPNSDSTDMHCLDFEDNKDAVKYDDINLNVEDEDSYLADPFDCMRIKSCGTRVFPDRDLDGWGTDGHYEVIQDPLTNEAEAAFVSEFKIFCKGELTWDLNTGIGSIVKDGVKYITVGGDCNDADFSQHPNPPESEPGDPGYVVDLPDTISTGFSELSSDKNCDGLDGDVRTSIFVSKRTPNIVDGLELDRDGSIEAPFATIQEGINAAQESDGSKPFVLVGCTKSDANSQECDEFDEMPVLPSGVSLIGGYEDYRWKGTVRDDGSIDTNCYVRQHNGWDTNDSEHDVYTSGLETDPIPCFNRSEGDWPVISSPGVTGMKVTDYTEAGQIQRLKIVTVAGMQNKDGQGQSTHAIVIRNSSSSLRVFDNILSPGQAGSGLKGEKATCTEAIDGTSGGAGGGLLGGKGGDGGADDNDGGNGHTLDGIVITPGTAGGPSGTGGQPGHPGEDGADGTHGKAHDGWEFASAAVSLDNDPIEVRGHDGWSEFPTHGKGGGGGDGGMGCWVGDAITYVGGGGGGGGGQAGTQGNSGRGGGYRIGLLLLDSPEVENKNNSFTLNGYGKGGSAGEFPEECKGGSGGGGGKGQICWIEGAAGAGGNGGSGGDGGIGKKGGAGADGEARAVLSIVGGIISD